MTPGSRQQALPNTPLPADSGKARTYGQWLWPLAFPTHPSRVQLSAAPSSPLFPPPSRRLRELVRRGRVILERKKRASSGLARSPLYREWAASPSSASACIWEVRTWGGGLMRAISRVPASKRDKPPWHRRMTGPAQFQQALCGHRSYRTALLG